MKKDNLNIGDVFGQLTVENIFKNKHKQKTATVKCACGYIFDLVATHLVGEGHEPRTMCRFCSTKLHQEYNMKKAEIEPGTKFGLLTAIKPGEPIEKIECGNIIRRSYTTICKCECGNECIIQNKYLKSGDTKSCGCMKSWLESQVARILAVKGINFTHGFLMNDLLTSNGYPVVMDFQIEDKYNNHIAFIECQGSQHCDDSTGEFGRLQREETDALKKQYCIEYNLKLYEIFFDEDVEQRVNEILTELNLSR